MLLPHRRNSTSPAETTAVLGPKQADPTTASAGARPTATITGRQADSGAVALGRLAGLGLIIFLVAFFFLFTDVEHRVAGYRIAHGSGIAGTATITGCSSDIFGSQCHADFSSSDGSVRRTHIVLNGPSSMARGDVRPAAIGSSHADEAWTITGAPWWRPSMVQLAALVPVALAFAACWTLLTAGPVAWQAQARLLRTARAKKRDQSRREEIRRGRVH